MFVLIRQSVVLNKVLFKKEDAMLNLNRKKVVALLCLLGITILPSCLQRPTGFGIIFSSNEGIYDTNDLYRMETISQNEYERLTFTPTISERNVLVSKTGDRIVFSTDRLDWERATPLDLELEPLDHVFHLDVVNRTLEDLTAIYEARPFELGTIPADVSSDEKRIAVITGSGDPAIMDFNGENKDLLTIGFSNELPHVVKEMQWSPDGKKLALSRVLVGSDKQSQNPGLSLVIYDIETEELWQIADHHENCYDITWSPNSQQLVVTCHRRFPYSEFSGPLTVRILNAENSVQRPAYEHLELTSCLEPSWSSDGEKLVFVCEEDDKNGLFVINHDGSGLREMKLGDLGNPSLILTPFWSPISDQIVYVAGNDYEHLNVYLINSDGSSNHSLMDHEASYRLISVYPIP